MVAIFPNKQISKREHEITANRDVFVTVRDGVKICVDVFRPDGRGKYPALVATSSFNVEDKQHRRCPDRPDQGEDEPPLSQMPNTITVYHNARYPSRVRELITPASIPYQVRDEVRGRLLPLFA